MNPKRIFSIAVPMLGLLNLAMFRFSMSVITPEIMKEYQLLEAKGGMLLSAYMASMAVVIIVGGYLSDKVGQRITMSLGLTISAFATLLISYCNGYVSLLMSLSLAGAGAGLFVVSLYAFAGTFLPMSRGVLLGVTDSFYALGGFIGPWLTAIMIMNAGWRSPLRLIGLVSFVEACLLWVGSRGRSSIDTKQKRLGGTYGILLKDAKTILLCVSIMAEGFAFGSFSAWIPSYLVKVGKLGIVESGFSFGLCLLTGVFGAIIFGAISDRIGRGTCILVSGTLAFALMIPYFSGSLGFGSFIILSAVLGFVFYPAFVLLVSAVQDHVGKELSGSATGLMQSVSMFIGASAPTMSGLLITEYGFSLALILSVAFPTIMYSVFGFYSTQKKWPSLDKPIQTP